ncbi:MAG: hypothetical protein AAF787_01050 [Chloroflexota bacterium]
MRVMMILIAVLAAAFPVLAQDDEADRLLDDVDTPAGILLELERSGVFPAGGTPAPIDTTRRTLRGNQFVSMSDAESAANFVLGGKLLFEPWDETEGVQACALVARAAIERDVTETDTERIEVAQINTFVDIGVTSMDEVYIADRYGPADDEITVERFDVDLADEAPIEIVAVMLDNTLTVYVNADRIVDRMEIEVESGTFAFALTARDDRTNCAGFDFWAYELEEDYVREGCEIITAATINQRGGPGTQFDVLSQLTAGEIALATGYAIDADGFTWWRMENELWMREDVVTARGYCRTLPQIPT